MTFKHLSGGRVEGGREGREGRGVKEGGLISARRRIRVAAATPLRAGLGRARPQEDAEHRL